MDPPHMAPISSGYADVAPSGVAPKLRLMCSYGGQIVPRPHDKSLSYTAGETRIVAIDRRSASLSSLFGHLASILPLKFPFALKYQLPGHDLDSLVSVATDEDFENMLDEYDRITSSPTPCRLRIFIFPSSSDSILNDSDSEKWFLDALRVTKIAGKEGFFESGVGDGGSILDTEVQTDGSGQACGTGSGLGPESAVLETSSSFGSSSSSVSMSNLPSIRVHAEDLMVGLDNQLKLQATDSTESDSAANFASQIQDLTANFASQAQYPAESKKNALEKTENHQENLDNPHSLEFQSTNPPPTSGSNDPNIIRVTGYPLMSQLDPHQQEMQYVTASPHYVTQYLPGAVPTSPYYTMYPPQLPQQYHYQPNQPQPIYLLPVGHAPPYSIPVVHGNLAASQFPVHGNMVGASAVASGQVPMNPPPVPPTSLLGKHEENLQSHLDAEKHRQQLIASAHMHNPSQQMPAVHIATPNYENEFSDDPALVQIYKSQPQVPMLPVQGHVLGKEEILPEALATENIKQPTTSPPM